MFSKALFKQSVKANWVRWTTITLATCAMLMIVVIVLGSLNISGIRDSLKEVFQTANEESTLKENAIDGYELYLSSVEFEHTLTGLENGSQTLEEEQKIRDGWNMIADNYNIALSDFEEENGHAPDEMEKASLMQETAILQVENIRKFPEQTEGLLDDVDDQTLAKFLVCFYKAYDGSDLRFEGDTATFVSSARTIIENAYLNMAYTLAYDRAFEISQNADFATLSGGYSRTLAVTAMDSYTGDGIDANFDITSFQDPATLYVNNMLYELAFYQVPAEFSTDEEKEMFAVSAKVLSNSAIATYQLWLDEGSTREEARESATLSISDQMPEKVAEALSELGNLDMNGLIIGSMFYRIAGLLLPMVFVITTANGLLAGQVDSGSMAYVLSTPTKRRTVTVTQMTFLITSLLLMFACLTVVSVISIAIVGGNAFAINYAEILLFNLGAFLSMFAIAGFCFMCSAIFNRTKHSFSIGGGLSIFMLVCTILGLFGSSVVPSAMRISAMNVFNYLSVITLFDTTTILSGGLGFIWKFAVLFALGIIGFIVGIARFDKKDLPL